MAIAYVGKGGEGTGTTTLDIPVPSGSVGDCLVAVMTQRTRSVTWGKPGGGGGWSTLSGCPYSNFGPSNTLNVDIKIADGTEGSTLQWDPSGTTNATGQIFRYSGVDGTTPVDVGGATTFENTTTAPTALAVTIATGGALLICVYTTDGNVTYTPDAAMTERDDWGGSSSAGTMFCDEPRASTGTTGTRDATATSSRNYDMVTFALRPASAAAGSLVVPRRPARGLVMRGRR